MILPRDVMGEYFAKTSENCKNLASFQGNDLENLEDQDCPKVQDLVAEEIGVCSSCPFRHNTTLHCVECEAN